MFFARVLAFAARIGKPREQGTTRRLFYTMTPSQRRLSNLHSSLYLPSVLIMSDRLHRPYTNTTHQLESVTVSKDAVYCMLS